MLTAILVTVLVLAVAAVLIFVFLRSKGTLDSGAHKGKLNVKHINSVGVAAKAPKVTTSSRMPDASARSVATAPGDSLKMRFLAVGVLAGAALAALTGKLFSVQVLSGSDYQRQAEKNLYTTVATPAPRGVVYDAQGIALITNRQVQTVLADSDVAENPDVMLRLSAVLGIPYNVVRNRILDLTSGAQSQRVVASDVSLRDIAYINEHIDAFPGVVTQVRTTRSYPHGSLAAHVLGYAGTASSDDLTNAAEGRDIEMGDAVGKAGIESAYDDLLAGDHGQRVLVTDAKGAIQEVVSETDPTKGNDLYLTLSARVQHVAEEEIKSAVKGSTGKAGSIAVIDVETGGILAMASYPTYEPETFVGGVSQDVWDEYQTEASRYPMLNRAISGTYPAASCFKAFTGMAGLTYGFVTTSTTVNCTGTWTGFGDDYPQKCWVSWGHGNVALHQAIVDSCDVYFYEIARSFYRQRDSIGADAMQDFIKEFGFGSKTGIEISGESEGRVPTPEWKADYFKDAPEQAQWLPGDISNMVIGQGYVLVTPLQEARAYAAIASGKLMKPHFLHEVRNSIGDAVLAETTEELSRPEVSEANLKAMREALHGVITEEDAVIPTFSGYSWSAAGKTGTAQVSGKNDFAWFSMYAPYKKPRYALSVCIEEGGGGADTAAPVAAAVMDAVMKYENGKLDDSAMKDMGYDFEAGIVDSSYAKAAKKRKSSSKKSSSSKSNSSSSSSSSADSQE